MKLVLRIISLTLILSTTSCAFLNLKTVAVSVNSYPSGAKIYVDDVYYGTTTKEIDVIPDKNHQLKLVKDGYQTVTIEMETKFSLRKGQPGYSKCKMDLLGSIFIIPIAGLKSLYCRDFAKRVYDADLEAIPASVPQENISNPQSPSYTPFSTRNYYLPPQVLEQKNNPQTINNVEINQNTTPPQPVFNNQSEFINNGNEAAVNENFNRKTKIDYYNWQ